MIPKKKTTNYWFTIEPYVFVSIANKCVLLYNTLDGVTIESNKEDIIALLQETLQKKNCGVVLLKHERYEQKEINAFIKELRNKYMGDIIDVSLSKGKPVQLLPFFNLSENHELYKKHNFDPPKDILEQISEVSIHVNNTTNIGDLIPFLQSIPDNSIFNIVGDIEEVADYAEFLSFWYQLPSQKNMVCSYSSVISLQPTFEKNVSYTITVQFPVDMQKWKKARQILLNQHLPLEYTFNVSSEDEYQQAEVFIDQYQIEDYHLNPVYTGKNIRFFKENIFLSKEDILYSPVSIKDIFANQSMNIYDFGKINIMPNGDIYANVNHPALGNIKTHSIYEIIYKEIENGKSWLRIRNQAPCTDCVYQWLCPSPSDYEIAIDRPNLCHVKP